MEIRPQHNCLLVILVMSWSVVPVFALEGDSLWFHLYEGGGSESFSKLAVSADGGYFLAGNSLNSGDAFIWLVKTDEQGNTVWSQFFGEPRYYQINALFPTVFGGAISVGCSQQLWYHNSILILQCDALGNSLWLRTTNIGGFKGVIKTLRSENGELSIGCNYNALADYSDALMIQTDSIGHLRRNHRYGTNHQEELVDMVATEDGGFCLAGRIVSVNGNVTYRPFLILLNSVGEVLWSRFYDNHPTPFLLVRSVTCAQNSGFILSSQCSDGNWVLRTDATGNPVWSQTFGQDSSDWFEHVFPIDGGGYVLAGEMRSVTQGMTDLWVVRIDEDGNTINSRTYGVPNYYDDLHAAIPTSDGGFLLGEVRYDWPNPQPDISFWLIKTDAWGDSLWSKRIAAHITNLAQANNGNYLIGGSMIPYGSTDLDYSLLCLEGPQPTAVPTQTPKVRSFSISFNFFPPSPNPFNPTTTISFSLPEASVVNLVVYDTNGRQVAQLVNGLQPAGQHQVTFDGSSLPSGLYLYRLTAGQNTAAGKMVLLK
jgi:hypothetical protein